MTGISSRVSVLVAYATVRYNVDPAVLDALLAHECDYNLAWIHDESTLRIVIRQVARDLDAALTYRQGSYSSALADFHVGRDAYDNDKDVWFGAFASYCYPILDASGQGRHYKRLNN